MLLYFELPSNKNEQLLRTFQIKKKNSNSHFKFRDAQKIDCILVFVGLQYKESIVLHNICNYKSRPFV